MTKIFISYRRDDSADITGRIYDWLVAKFGKDDVFKDVDNIPGGVNFKKYLENAVQQCAVELVIIGKQWLDIDDGHGQRRLDDADDFVRIEIESALNRSIPVIPLLVSGSTMPTKDQLPLSLVELTYRNGTEVRRDPDFRHDMERVIGWIEHWVKPRTEDILPPPFAWINIPAGKVTLERGWDSSFTFYSTAPLGTYSVEPFVMAKYAVTNAQFQVFIDDGGYQQDRYWNGLVRPQARHPQPKWNNPTNPHETMTWFEAMAFCRWLAEKTGIPITLPTEMQWQWAAIGDTKWAYPYGDIADAEKSNTFESKIGNITPVDYYPNGASPFGVMDMSGNVWEWTLTEYSTLDNEDITTHRIQTARGGAADFDLSYARAGYRGGFTLGGQYYKIGLRLVMPLL